MKAIAIIGLPIVIAAFDGARAQTKETVGSLAAKGYDVKGISNSEGVILVAMQKAGEVYVCVGTINSFMRVNGLYDYKAVDQQEKPLDCVRQR